MALKITKINLTETKNTEENPPKKDFNFDNIVTVEGVLEVLPDNYGFLRSADFLTFLRQMMYLFLHNKSEITDLKRVTL